MSLFSSIGSRNSFYKSNYNTDLPAKQGELVLSFKVVLIFFQRSPRRIDISSKRCGKIGSAALHAQIPLLLQSRCPETRTWQSQKVHQTIWSENGHLAHCSIDSFSAIRNISEQHFAQWRQMFKSLLRFEAGAPECWSQKIKHHATQT